MILFWCTAALMLLAAMLIVTWPLLAERFNAGFSVVTSDANLQFTQEQLDELNRQQQAKTLNDDTAQHLKAELKQKLAAELQTGAAAVVLEQRKQPILAAALALLLAVGVMGLYYRLGASMELSVVSAIQQGETQGKTWTQLLTQWTKVRPTNPHALMMLGNQQEAEGEIEQAVLSYKRLITLTDGHPEAMMQLAQTLFMVAGGTVTPEVRTLYQQTLAKQPDNGTALGLKGVDHLLNGKPQIALEAFEQALKTEADSRARQAIMAGISKARSELNLPVSSVTVRIEVADDMPPLPSTARILVFARPSDEPNRPPVVALPVSQLSFPITVVLDDSNAMMMGGEPLSNFQQLDITARLSLSGELMKSDYQTQARKVSLGAAPVTLRFSVSDRQ